MIISDFPQRNAVFGEGQKEYVPLPAHREMNVQGCVTTLWRGTWRERFKFLFTGELWLQQLSFNQPLQAQKPLIDSPPPRRPDTNAECTFHHPGGYRS